MIRGSLGGGHSLSASSLLSLFVGQWLWARVIMMNVRSAFVSDMGAFVDEGIWEGTIYLG